MYLNAVERIVLAELLERAADAFSAHGCNDFDLAAIGLMDRDCDELARAYHAWNGDPQEHEPGPRNRVQADFALMRYFAAKLDGAVMLPRADGSSGKEVPG